MTNFAAAALVVVVYAVYMVTNGLVSASITVPLSNSDVAASHPVYMLPNGWAFSIWSLLFLLEGAWVVLQILPARLYGLLDDAATAKVRYPAMLTMLLGGAWSYAFGNQLLWISFVMIAGYAVTLWRIFDLFDMKNYLNPKFGWQHKFSAVAFSAQAAWVWVATLIQFAINLLESGWFVTADFTTGLLFFVTGLAFYTVFTRFDVAYALISAWALFGIVSQQTSDSTNRFGCLDKICSDKCMDIMRICTEGVFSESCKQFKEEGIKLCPVGKSSDVANFCYLCVVAVAISLVCSAFFSYQKRAKANETGVWDGQEGEDNPYNLTSA